MLAFLLCSDERLDYYNFFKGCICAFFPFLFLLTYCLENCIWPLSSFVKKEESKRTVTSIFQGKVPPFLLLSSSLILLCVCILQ